MTSKSNAELRAEIKRLKADIRQIHTRENLNAQLRKFHHKRAKVRFHELVGKYVRAGMHFKAAVKEAKKVYNKIG